MVYTGQRGSYSWLVSESAIWSLADLVLRFHPGLHVCITSFDSSPLRLTGEELNQGWIAQGDVAISPPLGESVAIPHDQYDEWYLVHSPTFLGMNLEVFVSNGNFTLIAPEDIYKTFDPTWEKRGLEWLRPAQERFWNQLERLHPETYVAMGDNDIVVSSNNRFVDAVRQTLEPSGR